MTLASSECKGKAIGFEANRTGFESQLHCPLAEQLWASYWFISSFTHSTKSVLSTYCVSGVVPGTQDSMVSRKDIVPILKEFTAQWGDKPCCDKGKDRATREHMRKETERSS